MLALRGLNPPQTMLRHLSIKDFAVVRATELEFGPGMTVVSGETGAGKSLMVDALGFLSGLRADSGVVRHGAARAELAAEFALDEQARPGSGCATTNSTTRTSASCAA
jgi:ATPase involved in DNA repair